MEVCEAGVERHCQCFLLKIRFWDVVCLSEDFYKSIIKACKSQIEKMLFSSISFIRKKNKHLNCLNIEEV